MKNQKITNIQKVELEEGQTITINGAVIGLEIVKFLLDLQSKENEGIREYKSSYDTLTLFLASQAENITEFELLAYELSNIHKMKILWDSFRIPGTDV